MPQAKDFWAELLGTAALLLVGLSAICLDFASSSPVPRWIPDANVRRLLTGVIFAGAGAAIVYSPLGKRSGGHINPAVTIAFLRLHKIMWKGAAGYVSAQVLGALAGAGVVLALWRGYARKVSLGVTIPHQGGWPASLAAELTATFLLLTLILNFVDRPRLMRFTAAAAGLLVASLVFVEAPISGTSLNPARTLGPALVDGSYSGLWVYLVGPPLGALLAVLVYRKRRATVACGKLFHTSAAECRFLDCQYTSPSLRINSTRSAMTGWRKPLRAGR